MHDCRRRSQCKGSRTGAQAHRDWRRRRMTGGRSRTTAGQQTDSTSNGLASRAAAASGPGSQMATRLCYCRPCPCPCPCRRPCPEPGRRQPIDSPTRRCHRRQPTEAPTIESRLSGTHHANQNQHPRPSVGRHSPIATGTGATDVTGAHHCRHPTHRPQSTDQHHPHRPPHRPAAVGGPAAAEAWHPLRPPRAATVATGPGAAAARGAAAAAVHPQARRPGQASWP